MGSIVYYFSKLITSFFDNTMIRSSTYISLISNIRIHCIRFSSSTSSFHLVVELVGSPTFFFTAFPTVSLYAVTAGKTFMLLYVPVFFDFVEKYWWWNPETQRRNLNIAFHTLHLAFKIMLRIMILGLICIWFIRIIKYSVRSYWN